MILNLLGCAIDGCEDDDISLFIIFIVGGALISVLFYYLAKKIFKK